MDSLRALATRKAPANPNTNETARALLRYLQDLPNRPNTRVISGQRLHDFYGDEARYTPPTTNHPLDYVFSKTGQWPGIVSAEYTNWHYSGTNQRVIWRELNPVLIDYWKKGGLVELHFHPIGPSGTSGNHKENLDAILNSDGAFNATYVALLDQAVAGLKNLQDNGVVANLAPWNLANYTIVTDGDRVFVDEQPLIFFHFHGLKHIARWTYDPRLDDYQTKSTSVIRRRIYAPYIRTLAETWRQLASSIRNTALSNIRYPRVSKPRGRLWWVRGILDRRYVVVLNGGPL